MKKVFLIIIFLSSFLSAQNPNLGTSGAQFLQIPVGARAAALGGAMVGLTDDASSVFWNPAGITNVKSFDADFSYMNWFNLFDFNAAAIAYNVPDVGVFAAQMIVFTTDKMEVTTEEQPNGTGRFFDAGDIALGLTYSRMLTDKFSAGITVKYVYQRIWNETADGVAFDLGTQYKLDFRNLTIAMSMSNFGSNLKYDGADLNIVHLKNENYPFSRLTPARLQTEEFSLPLNFQVGICFDIFSLQFVKMRGAVDAVHPNDNNERLHFGTEFSFFDRFFLRGGYRYNYDDENFTAGAGANIPFGGSLIRFDYAFAFYDILPSVHRVSVGLSF
ncbi:MAG: PorV/PorQ family protein [Ignavibacteriaceae bacterium]|nr:PorV/PorQ family protein [Ignavibacteriaceae bacterium]